MRTRAFRASALGFVGLLFVLPLTSCKRRPTIEVDHRPNLGGTQVVRINAVDDHRAVIGLHRASTEKMMHLALVEDGVPKWSLIPPCDPFVDSTFSVTDKVTSVFCKQAGASALWSMGFDTTTGATLWASDDLPWSGRPTLESRRLGSSAVLENDGSETAVARDLGSGRVLWRSERENIYVVEPDRFVLTGKPGALVRGA